MMSDDKSMFKKMKDKITDEVNSATNKLQNIQILDQLATSIGQQVARDDSMPHQKLPELIEQSTMPTNSHFSLIYDNQVGDYCENDNELNSEISPQHQLFNEGLIRRLKPSDDRKATKSIKNGSSPNSSRSMEHDNEFSVIDINHLSSDLEDEIGNFSTNDDGEIDLLAERVPTTAENKSDDCVLPARLATYKARYRDIVHALRKSNDDRRLEKFQLETEAKRLTDEISKLKEELHGVKQQLESAINNLESDRKSNSSSPHQSIKQSNKIRDLEKLMAKCKESLKAKNSQLQILKNSLSEVDKFRDYLNELKRELQDLKSTHETWTLSIAEGKRVMHQEIEDKNAELESIKSQLKDATNRLMHQKSNIQNLESRMVSMSAAHQKERESLTREMTNAKNNSIKRLQKEHELQLERVRLDLEKSIEALKSEILSKDAEIIRNGQKQQELQDQNGTLQTELEDCKKQRDELLGSLNEIKSEILSKDAEIIRSEQKQQELQNQNGTLLAELEECKKQCDEYFGRLNEIESKEQEHLKKIEELQGQIDKQSSQLTESNQLGDTNVALEKQTQELQDQVSSLSGQLSQLKEINENLGRSLDEVKSEILSRDEEIIRSGQKQQELEDRTGTLLAELEECKKQRDGLLGSLNEIKSEILSKDAEIIRSEQKKREFEDRNGTLKAELEEYKKQCDRHLHSLNEIKSEILSNNEQIISSGRRQQGLEDQNGALLAELEECKKQCDEYFGRLNEIESKEQEHLKKIEELQGQIDKQSSQLTESNQLGDTNVALEKQTQELQDQVSSLSGQLSQLKEINEELRRQLDEVSVCQVVEASGNSIGETAKISEELANKDREIEHLKDLISQNEREKVPQSDGNINGPSPTEFEYLKNIGREPVTLARVISAIFKFDTDQMEQICRTQEAIHQVSS